MSDENPASFSSAWNFSFQYGFQSPDEKNVQGFAWAVRGGDSRPVPEPGMLAFLGAGLLGLLWFCRR